MCIFVFAGRIKTHGEPRIYGEILLEIDESVKESKHFNIRIICPCNVYPLIPHFYIEKLRFAGVYLFFLCLLQKINCGPSLEPPRRGGSYMYPQSMF